MDCNDSLTELTATIRQRYQREGEEDEAESCLSLMCQALDIAAVRIKALEDWRQDALDWGRLFKAGGNGNACAPRTPS